MECPGEALISHFQTVQQLLYTCGLGLILGLGRGVVCCGKLESCRWGAEKWGSPLLWEGQ